MELHAIKMVTIVAPRHLKDELVTFLKSVGISGYTYYYAFGAGEESLRGPELREAENVKFRILVSNLLAVSLMKAVSEKYFGKEKVIVFEHDANVIRHDKFGQIDH